MVLSSLKYIKVDSHEKPFPQLLLQTNF